MQNGELLAQSQVLGDQGGAIEQYGTKAAAEELEVVHPPILGTSGCLARRRRRILAIPLSVAAAMAFAVPTAIPGSSFPRPNLDRAVVKRRR